VRAGAAEADAGAEHAAVGAALLGVVAGVAFGAGVDGVVAAALRRGDGFKGTVADLGVAAGPGGLAAVVAAVALPAGGGELGPADRAARPRGAGRRRVVVGSSCDGVVGGVSAMAGGLAQGVGAGVVVA